MKKLNIKESLSTKNVRFGSYSAVLIVIVVAIAVVINLIFSALPENFKAADLTPGKLYTVCDKTKEMLKGLDKDVTITVLANEDSADDTLVKLIERYKDGSKHIKVKYKDPEVDLDAANNYSDLTQNSVIVSSDTKELTIDYNEIYVSDYSDYYTTGSYSTTFDGEGQLTSAIAAVSAENSTKVYYLSGHGETELSESLSSLITKQNFETAELNLMSEGSIPEDCACLIINYPQNDLGSDEANLIIKYLDEGGRALITAGYTENTLKNFASVFDAYGMKLGDGVVMESSGSYYQYPLYVLPNIESTDFMTDLDNVNILMPNTLGITKTESSSDDESSESSTASSDSGEGSDVTITDLLTSSDGAYLKTVENGQLSTYEKESGDVEGPFAYACLAEKEAKNSDDTDDSADADDTSDSDETADTADADGTSDADDKADADDSAEADDSADDSTDADDSADTSDDADESDASESADGGKMILISSGSLTDESITGSLSVANLDFYMDCLCELAGGDSSTGNISIDEKSMTPEYITVSSAQSGFWFAFAVIFIPAAILIAGFIIWLGRRKK